MAKSKEWVIEPIDESGAPIGDAVSVSTKRQPGEREIQAAFGVGQVGGQNARRAGAAMPEHGKRAGVEGIVVDESQLRGEIEGYDEDGVYQLVPTPRAKSPRATELWKLRDYINPHDYRRLSEEQERSGDIKFVIFDSRKNLNNVLENRTDLNLHVLPSEAATQASPRRVLEPDHVYGPPGQQDVMPAYPGGSQPVVIYVGNQPGHPNPQQAYPSYGYAEQRQYGNSGPPAIGYVPRGEKEARLYEGGYPGFRSEGEQGAEGSKKPAYALKYGAALIALASLAFVVDVGPKETMSMIKDHVAFSGNPSHIHQGKTAEFVYQPVSDAPAGKFTVNRQVKTAIYYGPSGSKSAGQWPISPAEPFIPATKKNHFTLTINNSVEVTADASAPGAVSVERDSSDSSLSDVTIHPQNIVLKTEWLDKTADNKPNTVAHAEIPIELSVYKDYLSTIKKIAHARGNLTANQRTQKRKYKKVQKFVPVFKQAKSVDAYISSSGNGNYNPVYQKDLQTLSSVVLSENLDKQFMPRLSNIAIQSLESIIKNQAKAKNQQVHIAVEKKDGKNVMVPSILGSYLTAHQLTLQENADGLSVHQGGRLVRVKVNGAYTSAKITENN